MRIWKKPISIEILSASHVGTAVAHLGIEFLEVGDNFIRGRVAVDARTRQPYGLLHGGVESPETAINGIIATAHFARIRLAEGAADGIDAAGARAAAAGDLIPVNGVLR